MTTIDENKKMIQSLPIILLKILNNILQGISNLRRANDDGIMVEVIEYENVKFK